MSLRTFSKYSFFITGVIVFLILCLFSACEKESVEGSDIADYDKDIIFNVTFSGKTLTSNGVKFKIPGLSNKDYLYIMGGTSTINGQVISNFDLVVVPNYMLFKLKDGEVQARFEFTPKIGDLQGTYQFAISADPSYYYSFIFDKTTSTRYNIDPYNSSLTIRSIQNQVVSGDFSCNLISGSTRIPATGSFKLHML